MLALALADWTDLDVAEHVLGVSIGLIPNDNFQQHKGIYWSDNPTGNALYVLLRHMVAMGILEYREEPDYQFRWKGLPSS